MKQTCNKHGSNMKKTWNKHEIKHETNMKQTWNKHTPNIREYNLAIKNKHQISDWDNIYLQNSDKIYNILYLCPRFVISNVNY